MLFAPNPTVAHLSVSPVLVDKASFHKFVKAQETAVYTFCFRLLGNPHLAESAAQNAFLDVCSPFPAVSLVDVLVAARRRCHEQLERGNGRRNMSLRNNQYLFDGLTIREREVLALYYGCQLGVREMAEILDCSVGVVRAGLLQARCHALELLPHLPLERPLMLTKEIE